MSEIGNGPDFDVEPPEIEWVSYGGPSGKIAAILPLLFVGVLALLIINICIYFSG